MKKVVVIGLDGFEPKNVEAMIQAGDLPNLKMLKDRGGYARLKTTPSALETGYIPAEYLLL